ncbi:hypothetical protein RB595_002312 [Gaeumannomyces hyphopodioides]
MDGSGANAASLAHSMPGSYSRPVMGAAQGPDKVPRRPQNPQMCLPTSMLDVYVHQQDGPYYVGLRSQRQGQVHLGSLPGLPPAFHQYRTTFAPSESSIAPPSNATDSGYGSGHRPSVGVPSTYGGDADHFTDTQSVTGRMEELCASNLSNFPVDHSSRHNANIAGWGQAGEGLMPNNGNNQVLDAAANVCSSCKESCRTPSDLKKHMARHTRPHRCNVANCTRTKGFGTANDLARHIRSRHPEIDAQGHFYKCNLGPCANGRKRWPRADNFRQHLLRKHKNICTAENIEEFVCGVAEPAAESSHNGPVGMHIPNVGSDPATIRSLTSRALGTLVDPEDRQADTRMADPNLDFSHHDRSMVGTQFSGMAPPTDSASQVGFRHPDDGQVMHSGHEDLHEDLHMGSGLPQAPFSFPRSDALEPWSGDEPVRSSTPEPHMVTRGPPNTIYQDRQPRSHLQLYPPAATDLSSGGSLSVGSEADPEYETFMDLDDDHPSECQPTEPQGDQDPPDEDSSSVANPETESQSIPAISLEEVPQEPGPSPIAASAPTLSRPAPGEDYSADIMGPLELENLLKRVEESNLSTSLGIVLGKLGYEKSKPPSNTKKSPSSNGGSSGPSVVCKIQDCGASFQRECELRKHMKRHDRPYGCTFKSCSKRFGSKSDWKRHENSQHSPVDVWKCDEYAKSPPGRSHNEQRCGKVCYRRETFKAHLHKEHGFDVSIGNANRINAKLASCRRGEQDCESAFWCGFCLRRIDGTQKDGRGTERFNHIDAHLSGRDTKKRHFDEWRYDDQDGPSHLDAGAASAAQSASGGSGRCSTSSPSSDSSRDKRRSGTNYEEHSRRTKRPKVGGSSRPQVWFCCDCKYFNSVALVDTCGGDGANPGCTHSRCPNCRVMELRAEMDLSEVA